MIVVGDWSVHAAGAGYRCLVTIAVMAVLGLVPSAGYRTADEQHVRLVGRAVGAELGSPLSIFEH